MIDVFDSQQSLEAFGPILEPILRQAAVTAVPNIQPVYRIIKG